MAFFDDNTETFNPPEGRVEAIAKVTGKGKYAAEYQVEQLCHAVLVGSTIPAGSITRINTTDAKSASGVIDILTHENKPALPGFADEAKIKESKFGLPVFHTNKIYFKGQPIACVVAETLEEALYAASLVSADYNTDGFQVDFDMAQSAVTLTIAGKDRGTIDQLKEAEILIEAEYTIQAEVHNPMEMHATIAQWTADDKLKLFDKNQGVNNVQRTLGKLFDMPSENVKVVSEFVGGGFGSGLKVWPHTLVAVMCAKQVKRPVKLVLTRPQMFHMVGYRPHSWQKIKLAADKSGKFIGVHHQAKHTTSLYENFTEGITRITRLIYQFENLRTESATVPLNLSTPTWMRGPGDCTGDFAVECAIDELSYKLNMDPVAIRLKNLSLQKDPESGKPWSTNFINECIERGATMIKWDERKAKPGSLSEGEWNIGYGVALGMWNAGRQKASTGITMRKDGSIIVASAITDIGTGTGTGMLNLAHEATGIDKNKITIELGNSDLPPAPSEGGSTGLSSISGAVAAAVKALKIKVASYAANINDSYKTEMAENIIFSEAGISLAKAGEQFLSYVDIWSKNKLETIQVEASSGPGQERQQYAFCSGAAHFCRVKVHTQTRKVKIDRMVAVVDGGKIVNEKPAANQISGASIGGIGMALMEELQIDARLGSIIANDLAGYHFAVNADAPIVEVSFIGKPDPNINPNGAKGLGEVGIIGVAAAIANAIYNATGKRVRDLPITPDKLV